MSGVRRDPGVGVQWVDPRDIDDDAERQLEEFAKPRGDTFEVSGLKDMIETLGASGAKGALKVSGNWTKEVKKNFKLAEKALKNG